jgi:hypothetical protein
LTISKKLNSQTKSKRKLKVPDETGAKPRESVVNTQDNPQNALNFGRDISSGSEGLCCTNRVMDVVSLSPDRLIPRPQ